MQLFNAEFLELATRINQRYNHASFLGDYNINLLEINSHPLTEEFYNMISNYMILLFHHVTRIGDSKGTAIDNIFIIIFIMSLFSAHHAASSRTHFHPRIKTKFTNVMSLTNFKKGKYLMINDYLSQVNWNALFQFCPNVDCC